MAFNVMRILYRSFVIPSSANRSRGQCCNPSPPVWERDRLGRLRRHLAGGICELSLPAVFGEVTYFEFLLSLLARIKSRCQLNKSQTRQRQPKKSSAPWRRGWYMHNHLQADRQRSPFQRWSRCQQVFPILETQFPDRIRLSLPQAEPTTTPVLFGVPHSFSSFRFRRNRHFDSSFQSCSFRAFIHALTKSSRNSCSNLRRTQLLWLAHLKNQNQTPS